LKTKYKYIYFDESDLFGRRWIIKNNKTKNILGYLEFYKPWKQWVFSANENAVFNDQCLRDILDFMGQLKDNPPSALSF